MCMTTSPEQLSQLSRLIRYGILTSTTAAGSGHPTTSLSAVELMAALFFGGFFHCDPTHFDHPGNDRLIFSKGHAAPLFYTLWAVAGALPFDELSTLRKFGSRLEGHPTMAFPYTESATGSLGQGLSIGVGMALNAKYLEHSSSKTYVLLGDSEMAEGSVWEAMQLATHYKLDNLIAVLDVNRLGQRGQTMSGHNLDDYAAKAAAFGWQAIVVADGHSLDEITAAYQQALTAKDKPVMIIAKTMKGKGVSFIENKDGWHGKALNQDELQKALTEIGEVDVALRGAIALPTAIAVIPAPAASPAASLDYPADKPVATRRAYGNALVRLYSQYPQVVVVDAEVGNSTYAGLFQAAHPERFFEMFIAEQNMAGVALGLSRRGQIPFASTFAAFWTRAFDQIRMGQYSDANVKFCGSHAGVSIGEDGASQMGLEDIAMFRTLQNSVVLYPSDAVATERLVEEMIKHQGIVYQRTTRMDTPILYSPYEQFPIGGSKVLRSSDHDVATVVAAGVTLHEALAAYDELQKEGIAIRVVDLYSVKPLDVATLQQAAQETGVVITVEDHYPEGGIGEAVAAALPGQTVVSLAVRQMPQSGKPRELLEYEEISSAAIITAVKKHYATR